MDIKKQAIKCLQDKKQKAERERLDTLSSLRTDKYFENLYSTRNALIIEQSKCEFLGQNFDKTILLDTEQKLCQQISQNTKYTTNPLSLLQPVVLCKKCQDKYFLNGKMCECLQNQVSDLLRKESGLNDFFSFTQSNIDIFDNKNFYNKIYSATNTWCDKPMQSKILNWGFFGNTGNGKTFLMQCMADKLMQNGFLVYFTSAFNLLDNLYKANSDDSDLILDKFLRCDVLFIDDLGTEKFFKNQNENYIYTIVNQRMISNKPIVFSTNLDLEAFLERYGERVFSRLVNKTKSKILMFENSDIRLKK